MTFRFFQSDSPLRGGLDSSAGNSLNEALLDLFDHSPGSAASKIRGYENINPTLPAGFPAFNPVFPTMIPDPINMAESIARVGQQNFNPVFPTMIPDPISMAESIARVGQQNFNPVFPTMIPDPINMAESIARVGQPGNMLALSIARPTGIF